MDLVRLDVFFPATLQEGKALLRKMSVHYVNRNVLFLLSLIVPSPTNTHSFYFFIIPRECPIHPQVFRMKKWNKDSLHILKMLVCIFTLVSVYKHAKQPCFAG